MHVQKQLKGMFPKTALQQKSVGWRIFCCKIAAIFHKNILAVSLLQSFNSQRQKHSHSEHTRNTTKVHKPSFVQTLFRRTPWTASPSWLTQVRCAETQGCHSQEIRQSLQKKLLQPVHNWSQGAKSNLGDRPLSWAHKWQNARVSQIGVLFHCRSDLKPVIVFIYGGAWYVGTSDMYPGHDLALNGDVVVVSFNYRLHVSDRQRVKSSTWATPRKRAVRRGWHDTQRAVSITAESQLGQQ